MQPHTTHLYLSCKKPVFHSLRMVSSRIFILVPISTFLKLDVSRPRGISDGAQRGNDLLVDPKCAFGNSGHVFQSILAYYKAGKKLTSPSFTLRTRKKGMDRVLEISQRIDEFALIGKIFHLILSQWAASRDLHGPEDSRLGEFLSGCHGIGPVMQKNSLVTG